MTKQYTKNVEVYLDYATIPTLNYFYHFTENKDDIETIRLFGLGRFNISKKHHRILSGRNYSLLSNYF